jgi:fucose 4-O-acetylase-like acetyltransferase
MAFEVLDVVFLYFPIICLYVLSSVLWYTLRFPQMMSGSSLTPVVCRRAHVLLCFWFVFLRRVYPMLPVSLDCPFCSRTCINTSYFVTRQNNFMLTSIYNDELNDSKILTHVLFKENLYLKIKYYNFIYLIRNPES